jgi:hypothetical protein
MNYDYRSIDYNQEIYHGKETIALNNYKLCKFDP